MDGEEINRRTSLQKRLVKVIFITVVSLSLLGVIGAGISVFNEARELQDAFLKESSNMVSTMNTKSIQSRNVEKFNPSDDEALIVHLINEDEDSEQLKSVKTGVIQTVNIRGADWRILSNKSDRDGSLFVVAQQTVERNEIVLNVMIGICAPIIVMLIVILLLINRIISSQFQIFNDLSVSLDSQDPKNLEQLPYNDLSTEFIPFIKSINGLLQRTKSMTSKQERFIADAAHELRTPVAALSILAENLKKAESNEDLAKRQELLLTGFSRLRKLVNQLLDLSRFQNDYFEKVEIVNLNDITKLVLVDLHHLAESKNINLGLLPSEDLQIENKGLCINQLIRNAVENALIYTRSGGRVDISIKSLDGFAVFKVSDSGPGLNKEIMSKVWDPFFRGQAVKVEGSGLGLSIIKEISQKLGGEVFLENKPEGGALFTYQQKLP